MTDFEYHDIPLNDLNIYPTQTISYHHGHPKSTISKGFESFLKKSYKEDRLRQKQFFKRLKIQSTKKIQKSRFLSQKIMTIQTKITPKFATKEGFIYSNKVISQPPKKLMPSIKNYYGEQEYLSSWSDREYLYFDLKTSHRRKAGIKNTRQNKDIVESLQNYKKNTKKQLKSSSFKQKSDSSKKDQKKKSAFKLFDLDIMNSPAQNEKAANSNQYKSYKNYNIEKSDKIPKFIHYKFGERLSANNELEIRSEGSEEINMHGGDSDDDLFGEDIRSKNNMNTVYELGSSKKSKKRVIKEVRVSEGQEIVFGTFISVLEFCEILIILTIFLGRDIYRIPYLKEFKDYIGPVYWSSISRSTLIVLNFIFWIFILIKQRYYNFKKNKLENLYPCKNRVFLYSQSIALITILVILIILWITNIFDLKLKPWVRIIICCISYSKFLIYSRVDKLEFKYNFNLDILIFGISDFLSFYPLLLIAFSSVYLISDIFSTNRSSKSMEDKFRDSIFEKNLKFERFSKPFSTLICMLYLLVSFIDFVLYKSALIPFLLFIEAIAVLIMTFTLYYQKICKDFKFRSRESLVRKTKLSSKLLLSDSRLKERLTGQERSIFLREVDIFQEIRNFEAEIQNIRFRDQVLNDYCSCKILVFLLLLSK